MGRTPNPTKTVTFTVSTTQMVRALLEALVERGFHGKNVAEAAERLISEKLQEFEAAPKYTDMFAEVRTRVLEES